MSRNHFSFSMDFRETPQNNSAKSQPTPGSESSDTLFDSRQPENALTVSQLTRRIKSSLEEQFEGIYLEAEIGSISAPASGHIYLTLKDEKATLDAVIWKSSAVRLSARPTEGDKVLVRGDITVYEPRGRYQMVISSLRPAGEGELRNRFELLIKKLRAEGLFEAEHKKILPENPQTVGLVTSASGAAVQDIIKVIKKRMPATKIIVAPCLVQGTQAPSSIIKALNTLENWGGCDLIIIGRGGGSLEDLQAFNDEDVARAIFNCTTPVISAVGHEVDISVCDLVADMRAATPSEAAEIAVCDQLAIQDRIRSLQNALNVSLSNTLTQARNRLNRLRRSRTLRDPLRLIRQRQQELDELAQRFKFFTKNIITKRKDLLSALTENLQRSIIMLLKQNRHRLELSAAKLATLSPLAILARGYSVTLTESGRIITDCNNVKAGDIITTRLENGLLTSQITNTGEQP